MAKSQESYSKKEKEKKRQKKNKDKVERREQRKADKAEYGTASFEEMIAYVDEDGNLTNTPPDPSKKKRINAADIVLGVPRQGDGPPVELVKKGRVKFFNDEKGYGFIMEVGTQNSIFVHANNCDGEIRENDRVTYEVEMGQKGPNAVRVKLAE